MTKKVLLIAALLLFSASVALAAGAGDYYKYGMAMFKKGNYKKAEQYFSQAAKLEPRNPAYYSALAMCYKKTGNAAMAKKYAAYAQALSKKGKKRARGRRRGKKIYGEFFTGFTFASMGKVNSAIDANYQQALNAGGSGSKQNVGAGFMAGVQGGYSVMKGLYVGPRLEFIGIFPATTTIAVPVLATTGSIQYGGSLFNILAGATYDFPLQGMPLMLTGNLYLGYGAAGVSYNSTVASPLLNGTINASYSGGTFAADITAGGRYKVSDSLSAGLSLGYRLAGVASVTANDNYQMGGFTMVNKGDILLDSDGNTMAVDFGGLIISLNADLAF